MLNNQRHQIEDVRGFTLVEILVALIILIIITTIAIPGLNEWVAKTRVRAGIEDLQNALRLAQAEAAKRNQKIEFSLLNSPPIPTNNVLDTAAADNGTYWAVRLVSTTSASNKVFVQGGDLGSRGVKVTGDANLIFNGLGRVLTSTGPDTYLVSPRVYRVASNTDKYPMCVAIHSGGGVRWCDPDALPGSLSACPADIICPQ